MPKQTERMRAYRDVGCGGDGYGYGYSDGNMWWWTNGQSVVAQSHQVIMTK